MTIKKWTYAVGLAAGLALVACTGENGQDGAPGADGTSCIAKALKDSSGFDIICGDESIGTIKNGEDGEDGKKGDKGDKVQTTGAYVRGIVTNLSYKSTSSITFWIGDDLSQTNANTNGFEIYNPSTIMRQTIANRYSSVEEIDEDFVIGTTIVASGDITLYQNTVAVECCETEDGYVLFGLPVEQEQTKKLTQEE